MWNKLINYYNTNAKFHSFVVAIEFAAVSAATSYQGGVPNSKSGWTALAGFVGGMVWGASKRWLAINVATEGVEPKQVTK